MNAGRILRGSPQTRLAPQDDGISLTFSSSAAACPLAQAPAVAGIPAGPDLSAAAIPAHWVARLAAAVRAFAVRAAADPAAAHPAAADQADARLDYFLDYSCPDSADARCASG